MVTSVWPPNSGRAFANAITKQAVCGRAKGSNVELEEKVARERMRALWWTVAAAVLFTVSAAGAQTPPLDREVKATPGREVRVGIYTSMRADCTAGPLPAIRLSVAPEHGAVTARRATLKATNVKQCLAAELPALVAFYRPKPESANDDRFELEVSFADGRKQIQRFRVIISNGANEGQRI
jgi:uncharacterized membrane protein